MKKYVIVIALAVTSVGFAQSSIKDVKGEATQKTEKVKKEVKSVKSEKGFQDAKEIQKEYTAAEKEEMKAAAKRAKEEIKKDAKDQANKSKEDVKNAASDLKSTLKEEASEVKKSSEKIKNNDLAKSIKATDLKGAELGQARASEAQKMIELKEIEMTTNDAYIDESRRRISIAKTKLQDKITAGALSEDEIASKKAIIEKAEARLANYESNVKNSKLTLREQKNKIINLYDKQ